MERETKIVIGDFSHAEKDGDEHIHTCLSCFENKLSVNQGLQDATKAGMYHCWHCGVSGIDMNGVTHPVFTFHRRHFRAHNTDTYQKMLRESDANTDRKLLATLLQKERGIGADVIEPFRLSTDPDSPLKKNRLAMPMYLDAVPCGYQVWRPKDPLPGGSRYKIEGARGLAGIPIKGPCTHVILSEGMFDGFQIFETIQDEWKRETRFVKCTCGSAISSGQIAEILAEVPETAAIYLGLDNDKISAAHVAYNLLRPYRNVHIALPPTGLGKDWDECFKNDPTWSKKYWVMALKGA